MPCPDGLEDLHERGRRRASAGRAPAAAARAAPRRGQAERQLLGRRQRHLPLPGDRATAIAARRCAAARAAGRRGDASTPIFDKFRADGRHRRGVHRRAGEALADRAAAHRARAGEVLPISTHDQILGGPSGPGLSGLQLPGARRLPPARSRSRASRSARCWPRTAWSAASASTSWSARDAAARSRGTCTALEINLRMVGTTHPFLALQFLTGGKLDRETGLFSRSAAAPSTTAPPTTCAPTPIAACSPRT